MLLEQLRKKIARAESQKEGTELQSPSLMLLVLVAALGVVLYATFLYNPSYRGDLLPFILVILAETYIMSQALLNLWTILSSSTSPRNFQYHRTQDELLTGYYQKYLDIDTTSNKTQNLIKQPLQINNSVVEVDVFVTVYGEPINVIEKTVTAARDILGKHNTYILDDGKSSEVKNLAKKLKVTYIERDGSEGAKAGNINNALLQTKGKYFVIFDADFIPSDMFLYETLPFFQDEAMSFVQTPQHYSNTNNLISRGAGYMQKVFYSLIMPGKNRFNAAFCVGTNVVFRRSAIESIGGMYQASKSEDIWTSLKLHEFGYKSVYIPEILAVGQTPDTIKSYSKQQLRWATGGFEILTRHNLLFNKKLTFDQRLQYFGTVSYYLQGAAVFLLLLLPPLHIFFNLSPVNLDIGFLQWAFYYSALYVMQIFVAFATMGGFKFQTLMLSTASFPIYLKALFNGIRGKDQAWEATGSIENDSPFNYVQPQLIVFVLLLSTSLVGIWKVNYTSEISVAIAWNVLNTIIFGSFIAVAFREQLDIGKKNRSEKKLKKKALKRTFRFSETKES